MTDQPLSPAAEAVFTAILNLKDNINPRHRIAAAALRAAADQVVPEDGDPIYGLTPARAERQVVRRKFLAIAAELEGITPQQSATMPASTGEA
jgi:hypothetical protein